MKVLVTTCCKRKSNAPELLPAIERYISKRISNVSELSQEKELPFFIFSGKYGLLNPNDPIPYYDYILTQNEVNNMVSILKEQVHQHDITEIELYVLQSWEPYIQAIQKACPKVKIIQPNIVDD